MRSRIVVWGGVLVAMTAVAWGCGPRGSAGPQTVKVAVTDAGFEPAEIKVHGGTPVTLLVTRKVEATCATEIVIADAGIRRELPLDEEVSVTFTPERSGEIRYACPMDMITGTMRVE